MELVRDLTVYRHKDKFLVDALLQNNMAVEIAFIAEQPPIWANQKGNQTITMRRYAF